MTVRRWILFLLFAASVRGESPSKTTTVRNYKLELFETGKRYENAKATCESRDAWLVEIKDEEIENSVRTLTKRNVWIGLYYNTEWKWNDLAPLRYKNWTDGSPSKVTSTHHNQCGFKSSSGSWRNTDCGIGYRYICQSDLTYPGSFNLTFKTTKKSFEKAKTACSEDDGFRLVEIKTAGLNSYIENVIGNSGKKYWTSGNDQDTEGTWLWGDGSPLHDGFTDWLTREPNGGREENCLVLSYGCSGACVVWVDVKCGQSNDYICQKDLSSGVCAEDVCSNRGSCEISGRRYECTCKAGYFGTKCEKDMVEISAQEPELTVYKGQSVSVRLNVKSYDGNVRVTSKKGSGNTLHTDTVTIPNVGYQATTEFSLGSQLASAVYYFDATPVSSSVEYSVRANLSVTVTDLCQSSPCLNGGTCSHETASPYYSCACKPAYDGAKCKDRKFVTLNNCKYHVNRDDLSTFPKSNTTCLGLEGALAMLKSFEIQDAIEDQISRQYGESENYEFWVGGYKVDNTWLWMDGTEIPLTGSNQKWANEGGGYMVLSSWKREVANMRWYSKSKTNRKDRAFVCEVPESDPCASKNCFNGGSCVAFACQANCKCLSGFRGDHCQIGRISVVPTRTSYTAVQNRNITVTLDITNDDGLVRVVAYKGNDFTKIISAKPNVSGSVNITIGPLSDQSAGTIYNFRATPENNLYVYNSTAFVTIVVQGPPSVSSITLKDLGIPVESGATSVLCNATGVPAPVITWKKDENVVTNNTASSIYQTVNSGFTTLHFSAKARTEIGRYVCYAENFVGGEKQEANETLFVWGKILLNHTANLSESASGPSTIDCTFEGYPTFEIYWKWKKSGFWEDISANQHGMIFKHQTTMESAAPLIRKTSTLKIVMAEYLGPTTVVCYATNEYENSSGKPWKLNSNLVTGRTRSYRLYYKKTQKRNFTEARKYCQSVERDLVKIPDNETQLLLATALSNFSVKSHVFIGAIRNTIGDVAVWRWLDGSFLYNETKYGRYQKKLGNIVDKTYVNWNAGEPNGDVKNCACLRNTQSWPWCNTKCKNHFGFICESEVSGIPSLFEIDVKKCSPDITVRWSPSTQALNVKHRVQAVRAEPNSQDELREKDEVPVAEGILETNFSALSNSTLYEIKIIVCPDCPNPLVITKSVRIPTIVPVADQSVVSANVTGENGACVVTWSTREPATGIVGFKISVQSVLARAASKKYSQMNNTENRNAPSHDRRFVFSHAANREYKFSIHTETCLDTGPPVTAVGQCISETAPPPSLSTPVVNTELNADGTMSMVVALPDETNGPISCIFVVMIYKPDLPSSESVKYNKKDLEKAMEKSQSSSLDANDAYIAIAISRSDVSDEEEQFTKQLGDDSSSSCVLTSTGQRRKRAAGIEGNNRKLEDEATYKTFIVTTTPGDGQVFFQTSDAFVFVKQAAPSSGGTTAAIVIPLILLICLVAAIIVIMKKRKNTSVKHPDPLIFQDLQNGEEIVYANLALGNKEPISESAIPLEQLESVYNSSKARDCSTFHEEFESLKEEAAKLEYPTEIASTAAMKKKNRYKNILPSDVSRVVLSGNVESSYVNACYIHGFNKPNKFIATQGPLPATVDDFWRMTVEEQCTAIVMLTKCRENGRVKCEKYWPEEGSRKIYGAVEVSNVQEESFGSYRVRCFKVKTENQETTVNQLHFLNWPDHGAPVATTGLLNLHKAVVRHQSNSPVVVHCSAGAGRTGAFIAYDYLSEEAKSLSCVDVYKCVLKLREQRVEMVQSCDQYVLLHKMLLEDYLFGNTDMSPQEVSNYLSRDTEIRQEFQNLSLIGPIDEAKHGDSDKHRPLNRNEDIIPYLQNKVVVTKLAGDSETPYINASITATYDASMKLIAAQGPLKASIEHFWRAVVDNEVNTIVMLTKCFEGKKEQSAKYWPDDPDESLKLKDITIGVESTDANGQVIVRQLQVTREQEERTVIHYQYTGWTCEECPENVADIIELIDKMHSSVRRDKDAAALIHCSDGAGRTGTFCAIVNLLERMKQENRVDVFRTVKDLRDCRPGMVQTLEQYHFCYKAVSTYHSSINLYSNFEPERNEVEAEIVYQNL